MGETRRVLCFSFVIILYAVRVAVFKGARVFFYNNVSKRKSSPSVLTVGHVLCDGTLVEGSKAKRARNHIRRRATLL